MNVESGEAAAAAAVFYVPIEDNLLELPASKGHAHQISSRSSYSLHRHIYQSSRSVKRCGRICIHWLIAQKIISWLLLRSFSHSKMWKHSWQGTHSFSGHQVPWSGWSHYKERKILNGRLELSLGAPKKHATRNQSFQSEWAKKVSSMAWYEWRVSSL